jgi:hypothetical protein
VVVVDDVVVPKAIVGVAEDDDCVPFFLFLNCDTTTSTTTGSSDCLRFVPDVVVVVENPKIHWTFVDLLGNNSGNVLGVVYT